MALSAKQQKFVDEYLTCFNATEAAKKAGYSEKTAYSIGHENLRKPEIAESIRQQLEANAMSREELLQRVGDQARLDISPYLVVVDGSVTLDVSELIAAGLGWVIKGIKPTKFGDVVEFHDSFEAKKLLAHHHGITKPNVAGTLEDPNYTVQMTAEEWRKEREKRRQEAAGTMAAFEGGNG